MGERTSFDGWLNVWKDEQGGLLTTDSGQALVGTFEVWLSDRLSKAGKEMQGGTVVRTGEESGKPRLDVGAWQVTQKGRCRLATMVLDGSQGAKSWVRIGQGADGALMSTSWQSDEERTAGFARKNADVGHEFDAKGNRVKKGTAGRSINQRIDEQLRGAKAPIDPNDIPF